MALDAFVIGSLKTTSMANREIFTLIAPCRGMAAGATVYFQRVYGTTYTVPSGYVLRILEVRVGATDAGSVYGPSTIADSAGNVFAGTSYANAPTSAIPDDKFPTYVSVPAGRTIGITNNHSAALYVAARLLCMLEPV